MSEADTIDAPDNMMGMPVEDFPGVYGARDKGGTTDLDLAALPLNDYGNGLRLLKRHGPDLLPVNRVGWHVWDGKRYARELGEAMATKVAHQTVVEMADELEALREAKKLPEGASPEAIKQFEDRLDKFRRFKNSSGNVAKIRGMLSSAEPYLLRSPKVIDADPWLLNCANGTLRLDAVLPAGLEDDEADPRLRRHDRRDLMTKLSPINFKRRADCPVFKKFLAAVQPDPSVQMFLQTWFGYCLSGDTTEQKLVIMHGLGSNGKSTLISTLVDVFGDYAATLDIRSFMANDKKGGGDATPDIARLPGCRLVVASEPERGARLSESSVKVITGGERMAARQLFQEQFEFEPNFKVVISCNHRPVISGQDHGIWRRILIVPFSTTVDESSRDAHLKAKLVAEASGILGWLLDGLAIYREQGLVVPQAILEAVDEYRNESDPVGQFLKSCTAPTPVVGPGSDRVQATVLYENYAEWCRENSAEPVSTTAFGKRMIERGFKRMRVGVRFYQGLRLIPKEQRDG